MLSIKLKNWLINNKKLVTKSNIKKITIICVLYNLDLIRVSFSFEINISNLDVDIYAKINVKLEKYIKSPKILNEYNLGNIM